MRGPVALLAPMLVACSNASPAVHAVRGEGLGTTWSVKWVGDGPTEGEAEAAIVATLAEVDAAMSSWRDDSELAAIRAADGPVPVSEQTYDVVRAALDIAAATGGAFDPTVEPLMRVWGFRGARRAAPPTEAELDAARAQVGWDRVVAARDAAGVPHVDGGGTSLDLSAIAKGHAVDRVSAALSALGAAEHLVEIGGEVRAHGRGPGTDGLGGPWRLGIDAPDAGHAPGESVIAVVPLVNASLATSGNYRSRYDAGGVPVVHTMDPRTGRPFDGDVLSASVLAPDCRTADGWATALMVLGEAGLPLVTARPDLHAWLVVRDGDGVREVGTPGFPLAGP